MTQYLLCLCGPCDDMPVRLFATEWEVLQFCRENPPEGTFSRPTSEPLEKAFIVNGCGPSDPFGYKVTRFVDGEPEDMMTVCWDGEPVPESLFTESSPQEEWDMGGSD